MNTGWDLCSIAQPSLGLGSPLREKGQKKSAWEKKIYVVRGEEAPFLPPQITARLASTLKNGFGKCLLFVYQPTDEKIKTWPLRFPAKENPNMEKALFDWPIVLHYDVKAKYRSNSRKF